MSKPSQAVLSAVFAAVVAFAASAAQPTQREIPWIGAPKGICITNVVVSGDGVSVRFVTDLPPPYRVGIHAPAEIGLARMFPADYADVSATSAFIPGDFMDENLFVQVYKPDARLCPPGTRRMTAEERAQTREVRLSGDLPRYVQDPCWYDSPPSGSLLGFDPEMCEVVGDGTWANFLYTTNTSVKFTLSLWNRQSPGTREVSYNTNSYSFAVSGRDPGVGTGFRIVGVETEDPSTGEPGVACLAAAAYSARTNMSQAVLVKRGVFCLSAHGGWKYSVDWEGRPVMVPCTNAVPDRVYPEGI